MIELVEGYYSDELVINLNLKRVITMASIADTNSDDRCQKGVFLLYICKMMVNGACGLF